MALWILQLHELLVIEVKALKASKICVVTALMVQLH
jgi:hypothetical protein